MRRLLAALIAVAVLSGCGERDTTSIERGGRVPGATLTIVSLLPREGPRAAATDAINRGIKLAIADAGGEVGEWALTFDALDAPAAPAALGAQTQAVLRDISAIAAVSDLDVASARVTVPLLNAAGLLQVSPLVPSAAVRADPLADPSGEETFVSLAPGPAAEARALLAAARGPVAIEAESGDPASERLADALAAAHDGEIVPARRARTVIYAGTDAGNALGVLEAIADQNPRARLLASQALAGGALPGLLPAAVRGRLSFATTLGAERDPAFAAAYRAAYGEPPRSPWAREGWLAGQRVVAALRAAGPRANVRQAVIDAFLAANPADRVDGRPMRVAAARELTR